MPNGMYLLAIKPIKKGDELTVSYISNHVPHFNDPTFVLSSLEQTYGFVCACEPCRGRMIHQGKVKMPPNLFQQRMGHLVTETPGLTEMLNQLFDASHFSNSVVVPERVIQICEAIRVKFGHLFDKEPVLAFIVSRNYVRLLSPKNHFPIRIISDYPYWIGVFEKALLDVYPERSMFHVWCSFYQSLFKLLHTNVTLQEAYHCETQLVSTVTPPLGVESITKRNNVPNIKVKTEKVRSLSF